jgi:hypothetical protein
MASGGSEVRVTAAPLEQISMPRCLAHLRTAARQELHDRQVGTLRRRHQVAAVDGHDLHRMP